MKATKALAVAILSAVSFSASAQVVSSQATQQTAVSNVVTVNSTPQNDKTLTNDQLSTQYKLQISVIESEIKTLKAQAKLYKEDAAKAAEVASMLGSKKSELKSIKEKKKIVEKAIKAEKDSKKAADKAAKAQRKAQEAAAKAAQLHK